VSKHTYKLALELVQLGPPDALSVIAGAGRDNLGDLTRSLEGIAEWATWLARYVDERHGGGCGDQGHKPALASANRAAKTVWCKSFGYNGYVPRNPHESERRSTR
jgi:hypothetical protein